MTTTNQPNTTDSGIGLGAAVTAVVLWSASNVVVREIPLGGVQIAFWRITLGAVVYLAALRMSGRTLTWRQLVVSAPAAIAIGFEIAVFFVAIKITTVANTTIIGSLQPLVLLLFGIRRFGEQLTGRLMALALVAVGGVSLVVLGSRSQAVCSPLGDVLAFVAMLLFAAYYFFAKRAREEVPAFQFQAAVWVWGSVSLLPVAVIDAGGIAVPSWSQWAWLALLLAISGTGHQLMNWAHAHVQLSTAGMLSLGIPVLSAAGAAVFLDEPLRVLQVAGMAVVLGSLVAVIRYNATLAARTRAQAG